MHHNPRRLLPSTMIAATALIAVAALAPAAASAQTNQAPAATATSTQSLGMRYADNSQIGSGPEHDVHVTLAGTTFTIDDIVSIKAGTGCNPVAGDATKVTCVAPKEAPNGSFKPFTVILSGGRDHAYNQTSGIGLLNKGAPMLAFGGAGEDRLVGADAVDDELHGGANADVLQGLGGSDELKGESGKDTLHGGNGNNKLFGGSDRDRLVGGDNDDLLDGGSDADTIIGGSHNAGDTVDYQSRSTTVKVDLARPDLTHGEAGEGDTIRDVENVLGGTGDDTLIGNAAFNDLNGLSGNDHLDGREGGDVLVGGFGRDVLIPSFNADGVGDLMDCDNKGPGNDGNNGDLAFRFLADGDSVNDCEQVIDL